MPKPVFIVGMPRSGTTLLAAMIGSHSMYSCGPETHVFSKISPRHLAWCRSDPKWPARAAAALCSVRLSGRPVFELFGLSFQEIYDTLACQPPSIAAIAGAMPSLLAAKEGKPYWAEKTPNHILYIRQILDAFPEAKIIRVIRDPRDSVPSILRLPWTESSIAACAFLWADWHARSRKAFETKASIISVRYEDLIREPRKVLSEIVGFLGVGFEDGMLAREGSDLLAPACEPWKRDIRSRIDPDRAFEWKRLGNRRQVALIESICGDGIRYFGYEHEECERPRLAVYPVAAAGRFEIALASIASQGVDLVPVSYCLGDSRPMVMLRDLRELEGWGLIACWIFRRINGWPTIVVGQRSDVRSLGIPVDGWK